MKIKALFVDLGGVLILNKVKDVVEKYQKSDGLTLEMTSKIFRFIQTTPRTEAEIESYLNKENIDPKVWDRFSKEFYSSETRNDSLIDLLFLIKARGVRIIITTNNSGAVKDGLKKYKIDNLANIVINSSEYMVAKPDKEFWEVAFKETKKLIPDILPQDILVIDDSHTNCLSAEEYGFQTLKYVPSSESQAKILSLF